MKNILLIVHLILALNSTAQIDTSGLLLFLNFDGNIENQSKSGLSVTNKFDINFTMDRFGNENSAYVSGSGLAVSDTLIFDNLNESLSIASWIQYTDPNAYSGGTVFSLNSICSQNQQYINFTNNPYNYDLTIWNHYSWVFKGDSISEYLNGELKRTLSIEDNNRFCYIPPYYILSNLLANVDEFFIFNRILSDSEIMFLSQLDEPIITSIDTKTDSKYAFPNPLNGITELPEFIISANIFNLSGNRILTSNNRQINCSEIISGLYILEYTTTDKHTYRSKILIK